MTKKRWLSLLVENDVGVLARISGLFSGKAYNLDSLTVGITEDTTISRMTIGLTSDDGTFEQIKKQLNRSVEVIRVLDFTDIAVYRKELMFVKVWGCSEEEIQKLNSITEIFPVRKMDENVSAVLLECLQEETENNDLIAALERDFYGRMEIVRGGSVAIEAFACENDRKKIELACRTNIRIREFA